MAMPSLTSITVAGNVETAVVQPSALCVWITVCIPPVSPVVMSFAGSALPNGCKKRKSVRSVEQKRHFRLSCQFTKQISKIAKIYR